MDDLCDKRLVLYLYLESGMNAVISYVVMVLLPPPLVIVIFNAVVYVLFDTVLVVAVSDVALVVVVMYFGFLTFLQTSTSNSFVTTILFPPFLCTCFCGFFTIEQLQISSAFAFSSHSNFGRFQ